VKNVVPFPAFGLPFYFLGEISKDVEKAADDLKSSTAFS